MERLHRPNDHARPRHQREHVTPAERLRADFDRFHADNPKVYAELVRRARQLLDRGIRHYSIKGLYEIVRFHSTLDTTGEPFLLNNNYTAHYARLIMEQESDLRGFFHLREQRV